jgi:hypothetical protein
MTVHQDAQLGASLFTCNCCVGATQQGRVRGDMFVHGKATRSRTLPRRVQWRDDISAARFLDGSGKEATFLVQHKSTLQKGDGMNPG